MPKGKPPVNGFDKRPQAINRKGRPKSFDQLRELAQQIAHEALTSTDGTRRTVAEAILRKLATENPERFLEIAFGKVPQPIEQNNTGKIELVVTYADSQDADTPT